MQHSHASAPTLRSSLRSASISCPSSFRKLYLALLGAMVTLLLVSSGLLERLSPAANSDAVVGSTSGLQSAIAREDLPSSPSKPSTHTRSSESMGSTSTKSADLASPWTPVARDDAVAPRSTDLSECEKRFLSNMYTASKSAKARNQTASVLTTNPHFLLQRAARESSARFHCRHSGDLYYTRLGHPHFYEGTKQVERALVTRGWTHRPWSPKGIPEQISFFWASCRSLNRPYYWSNPRLPRIVSGLSAAERVATTKQHFMRSIRAHFRLRNCDYRALFPETIALGGKEECEAFLHLVDRPTKEALQATWFLKSHVEVSFGRGVRVLNLAEAGRAVREEAGGCDAGGYRFVIQKGVADILRYKGGKTQGRSYILVSSLMPEAKIFFFPGYVNVASPSQAAYSQTPGDVEEETFETSGENGESEDDEDGEEEEEEGENLAEITGPIEGLNPLEHVANLKANQGATRVSHQVLNTYLRDELGVSEARIVRLRHRLKLAATHVFLALRSSLGKPRRGSFALLGLDYVITQKSPRDDLDVKILETNCNCELFFHEQKWGRARVRASEALVPDMVDLVISANEEVPGDSKVFREALLRHAEALRNPAFSVEMDNAIDEDSPLYVPRTWELIHSDANPVFSLVQNKTECF